MAFFTEPEPQRATAVEVAPGIRRVVANNPSGMTYHGTNTYLVDTDMGLFVIDPGPASDEPHFDFLMGQIDGAAGIIVTHNHSDHFGLVPRIKAATGLAVYASDRFADDTFQPDVALRDGHTFAGLTVLYTPGHAVDHICLATSDGTVFTGDHIMTWSSSMIMRPNGDMGDYVVQLERFVERGDRLFLPGHGPALADPAPYVRQLLAHRVKRETEILARVRMAPATAPEIAAELYHKPDEKLMWAAERNVEAHLAKLERAGLVRADGDVWRAI